LRRDAGEGFPERVTAFRDEMAVHGRYRLPCPVCGAPVQRIVYAENETNYCARCQTGGVLLADRSLSRLLKADWPRRLEDREDAPALPESHPGPSGAGLDRADRTRRNPRGGERVQRPRRVRRRQKDE